jgi:iron(III) transport system ATP-binding protein
MLQIACEAVCKVYGRVRVLNEVSLRIDAGERLAVLGPSGAGKTTLLRVLAGLDSVDAGQLRFNERIVSAKRVHLAPCRRRVGMVFQDRSLWPHLTLRRQFALVTRGRTQGAEVLGRLGLSHLLDCRPGEISGGEAQRAACALALAAEPELLLLDEPHAQLDAASAECLDDLLTTYQQRWHCTCVLVTHDCEEAAYWGDRVAVLAQGRLLQAAAFKGLYTQPASAAVARQTGPAVFLEGGMRGPRIAETPLGRLPISNDPDPRRPVTLVLRPEHWQPTPEGPVSGSVVSARFLHGRWLTDIAARGVRLQVYLAERASVSEAVHLRLVQPAWALSCP